MHCAVGDVEELADTCRMPRSPASSTQMTALLGLLLERFVDQEPGDGIGFVETHPCAERPGWPRLMVRARRRVCRCASMAVLIVRVLPVPAAPRIRMTWSCESQTWRQIACCSRESVRSLERRVRHICPMAKRTHVPDLPLQNR